MMPRQSNFRFWTETFAVAAWFAAKTLPSPAVLVREIVRSLSAGAVSARQHISSPKSTAV
jgi:hypothetical protein